MPPISRSDSIPIGSAEDPLPGRGRAKPGPHPEARDSTRRNHVVSVRLSPEQLSVSTKTVRAPGLDKDLTCAWPPWAACHDRSRQLTATPGKRSAPHSST